MYYNIKNGISILLFFSYAFVQAQGIFDSRDGYKKVGSITTSALYPIAINESFVATDATLRVGADSNVRFHISRNLFTGIGFDFFGYEINDTQFTGSFDRGAVLSPYVFTGYNFYFEDHWVFSASGGLGWAVYSQKQDVGDVFKETGISYRMKAEAEYRFNKYLGAFLAAGLRLDRLNINTPEGFSKRFNQLNYSIIQLGIRFTFWNDDRDAIDEKQRSD